MSLDFGNQIKIIESGNIYEKFKVKSVKSEGPKCVMYLQKL